MLGSIERELGDLDRVLAWTRVFGMVNSAAGFNQQPRVMNGFSDLILELFGPDRGAHSRSAVGMAELPFDLPVEIEAELEISRLSSVKIYRVCCRWAGDGELSSALVDSVWRAPCAHDRGPFEPRVARCS